MATASNGESGSKLAFAALFACLTAPASPRPSRSRSARPIRRPTAGSRRAPGPSSSPGSRSAERGQAAAEPGVQSVRRAAWQAWPPRTLSPEQRAIVERVNGYLSGVQALTGNFIQIGPDGSRTQGDFVISKPGRVRFEYDDPSPIELIADGSSVVVRDRRLATQDVYPLSQTPLRFLLSDRVDLAKDTHLVAVYADDVFVTVVVEEKSGIVGTSRLMIMFSAKDMQLKQWTVTDPQGYDTTVAVYNLDTSKRPDPAMFKIDYTRYHN